MVPLVNELFLVFPYYSDVCQKGKNNHYTYVNKQSILKNVPCLLEKNYILLLLDKMFCICLLKSSVLRCCLRPTHFLIGFLSG